MHRQPSGGGIAARCGAGIAAELLPDASSVSEHDGGEEVVAGELGRRSEHLGGALGLAADDGPAEVLTGLSVHQAASLSRLQEE
jgi:hypothetical protein